MNAMRQKMFRKHAETRAYKQKVMVSATIIGRAFKENDSWYVAVSGGKDSTVVLDLVRSYAPGVKAVASIQEWRLPETAAYLDTIDNLVQVGSGSAHHTGWGKNWKSEDDMPDHVAWLGDAGQVLNYGQEEKGIFLGLRADEAKHREMHIKTAGTVFFNKKNNVWQCNPIAWWSIIDVWAYIVMSGIQYNLAYDVMDSIGVPLDKQRIGPLAIDKALGYGQLAILKKGWPDLWRRYVAAHPEASMYV